MLIATFGPTTGWLGKTITFEDDAFVLQDHGPISAGDVMQYDQQGHLLWASDQARAWVKAKAMGREPAQSNAGFVPAQRRMRFARSVLSWNAWCFVAAGVFSLFALIASHVLNATDFFYVALLDAPLVVPAAVILFVRPAKAIAVRRWLKATSPGDFGWAVFWGYLTWVGLHNWTSDDRSYVLAYASLAMAFAVFGILSVRGVLALRRPIRTGLEPRGLADGHSSFESAGIGGEASAALEAGSPVEIPGSGGPAGVARPRQETPANEARAARRRGYLDLVVVGVVVVLVVAVALIPTGHKSTGKADNWAGYVTAGRRFTSVTATWTQPEVHATWSTATRVDIWVGLDGATGVSSTVEQTGINCSEGCVPWRACWAWYEMVPRPPVRITTAHARSSSQGMAVNAGDTITASVTDLGDQRFRLMLIDDTRGESFSTVETSPAAKCDSAEIIVEAQFGSWIGLAEFDPVHFTDCLVDGRPIGSFKADRSAITTDDGHALTSTSAVGADGTSFAVTRR